LRESGLGDHANLVGVAPSADYQITQLKANGFMGQLLLDPNDQLRTLVGATGSMAWRDVANPKAVGVYWRARRQAAHSDADWSRLRDRPGFIVTDADLNITWAFVGQKLGDYPSVSNIIEAVEAAKAGT